VRSKREKMMDKIRILLVDDHIPFLKMAVRYLSDYENLIVVGTAQDGVEALTLAAKLLPDVVLLDVNMPGLSGIETTPRLRQILPEVGIIILSFQNADSYREAALLAGADDYIQKDTLAYALVPTILRVSKINERFVSLQ
jgi:DNA-binding NarL/FixJ family response regulator